MSKFCVVLALFALVALTLAQVPVNKGPVKLSEGKDLKTASSFGGYGLGFGYGGYGGYGGFGGYGWGLPLYGLGGWGGLGGFGYGGFYG